MMLYTILSTRKFDKRFEDLEADIQAKVKDSLQIFATNPYAGKNLHGKFKGLYSLRIGNYIIYSVDNSTKSVTLYTVGKRQNIVRQINNSA